MEISEIIVNEVDELPFNRPHYKIAGGKLELSINKKLPYKIVKEHGVLSVLCGDVVLIESKGLSIHRRGDTEVTQRPVQETLTTADGRRIPISWKITCRSLSNNRP